MNLVHIKMLKTKPGSSDGMHTKLYEANKEYDVSERLAGIFVDQLQIAEVVKPKKEKVKEEIDEDLIINKKKNPLSYDKKIMGKDKEENK